MKVIVTGGTGFIGSHTVVELQQSGIEVLVIDNLSNSYLEALDGIENITGKKPEFHEIDLKDSAATSGFFEATEGIDAILHFAAFKAVAESIEKPFEYYRNNILSLINVLEGMRIKRIPRLVFSSSCTVYGIGTALPVREDMPMQNPSSPYGSTKIMSEQIIMDFISQHDFAKAVSLRYFNPIGAHKSHEIGERPVGPPNNLIPYITQCVKGNYDHLRIWGDDYDTHDGTAVRDYIHVSDVARAHVMALKRMTDNRMKKDYDFFNLGTGKGYSVLDIVNTFEKVNRVKVPYTIYDRRPGDVDAIWANADLAASELGWEPEFGLEDMLRSAWQWEQNVKEI